MASIAPTPKLQFLAANGTPLVGGKLYSYAAGTTTPLATYTDESGGTLNTNPVILDSRGEASVWLGTATYKLRLTTAADVEVWTVDGLNKADAATLATLAASGGAALVGFLPPGSGATARTVQSKLQDVISPLDYGAAGNGSGNDAPAIQAAIDYAVSLGGQTVSCGGLTYRVTAPLIIKDDVKLDLQGGKIVSVLSGANDYGVRLRNRAEVCNGEIEVQSGGSPGSQGGIHAPIVVGPFYGDGGTVANPSVDEGVTGWAARNLKLSTNCDGKVCVQIVGGANNGVIENIEVPSSSTIGGVVHLDWGYVGTINSGNITTSRANFDAGTAYTTHPNNIIVRNIKVGALTRTKTGTDTGSHIVRLSGVYNVVVQNVVATQCTYAAVRTTAGDVGFEFAPAAVKPMGMQGIRWNNISVQNTTNSWLVYCDSYADNIATAIDSGYTPLIDPLMETDMIVDQVTGKGSGGASATPGLYVIQIRGAQFTNINASGYSYGCLVDEQVYNVDIHGTFYSNRGHGIFIDHGTKPPQDVRILPGTHCYQNGTDAGFSNPAGIALQNCIRVWVDGALMGHRTAAKETTQSIGILLSTVTKPTDVKIENCYVFSVKTSGTAYSLLTSTDYGYVKLFRNNTAAAAITTKYGGLNVIPINRMLTADGREILHNIAQREALSADTTPTAGTWTTGDLIFYSNPPSGKTGTRCETAGSPGTWAQF